MLVDSHTHLYLDDFATDRDATIRRAIEAGVGHLMFPNVDLSTIAPMKDLAGQFPDMIDMAIGLHPTEVNADFETSIVTIENELSSGIYKAVGEIGMDLYWDDTFKEEQMTVFKRQCDLAVQADLPVIIHCRNALEDILEVFDSLNTIPRGVFHSFGGSIEDVNHIRQYGNFYFGINGIVTFKNSKLRDILPLIGIDQLLLETDSPYLAPVPKRGKRNESSFMIHTAAYVSEAMGLPYNTVADATTANYFKLFGGRQ